MKRGTTKKWIHRAFDWMRHRRTKRAEDVVAECRLSDLGHALWLASLSASGSPNGRAYFERMNSPRIGDLVMEVSTIYRADRDRIRIGRLVSRTGRDGDWNIRINGHVETWTNASFVALPDTRRFQDWAGL